MSNGNHNITWLPPLFANAGGSDIVVGITSDARWFVQHDPPAPLFRDRIPPWILPIVQPGYGGDYTAARELVGDRLKAAGLSPKLVETFPFFAVVELAFRSSGFWAINAAAWLPHFDFDESFANVLLRFTLDKRNSQSDRRLVEEHLHRWEAGRGVSLLRPPT